MVDEENLLKSATFRSSPELPAICSTDELKLQSKLTLLICSSLDVIVQKDNNYLMLGDLPDL